jgi:hypothetical protein
MLSTMRTTLSCLAVVLFTTRCLAQSTWSVPDLHWLTPDDAISKAHLSAEETNFLKNLTQKVIAGCVTTYPGAHDPHTASGIFKLMRVRHVQLSPQGDAPALLVQGSACMCGATGNCSLWLIDEQVPLKVQLQTIGIQTFGFEKSSTSNRFDIVLGQHSSATESILQRFKFDGTTYKRFDCADAKWADKNGNTLNPPKITPGPC